MQKTKLVKLIGQALSFEDIQKIMLNATGREVKIIELNSVCKSKETIDEILNKNNDCAILYIPVLSETNGHYVSIFESEDGNSIYFCDSYGNSPKELIDLINSLGFVVDKKCLFVQMEQKYKNGFMNIIKYQTEANGVASCGRYACANLIFKHFAKKKV